MARTLQRHGVGSDDIVGIMAEPTTEVIIAILAVLKAGAAYCPIDPTFPVERVQQLLTDSRMELLISPPQHVDTHAFQGTVLDLSNPALYAGSRPIYRLRVDLIIQRMSYTHQARRERPKGW